MSLIRDSIQPPPQKKTPKKNPPKVSLFRKYTAYMDNLSLITEHWFTWDKIVLLKKVYFPQKNRKETQKNTKTVTPNETKKNAFLPTADHQYLVFLKSRSRIRSFSGSALSKRLKTRLCTSPRCFRIYIQIQLTYTNKNNPHPRPLSGQSNCR